MNPSLPLLPPTETFITSEGVNKQKKKKQKLNMDHSKEILSLEILGSAATVERAAAEWEGRHVCHVRSVCLLTLFAKLKMPLSPGNRSCATQMVPSLQMGS